MAGQFYVIPCTNPDCQKETWIPVATMQQIAQQRAKPAKGRIVNFVCPHCGFGTKNPVELLHVRESRPTMRLDREPLYGATVRCGEKKCKTPIVAYTKCAAGNGQDPTIAPQYWRSTALECPAGHRAQQPSEVTGSKIVAISN